MRKYNMRLNPKKNFIGVDRGKILAFFISQRGIKVATKKIYSIINMPPLRNISQLCTLQGRIQDIHHFVASLVDWIIPFTHLLKKDVHFDYKKDCKQDLDSFK
jgi:hypothetical protein